jgi:SAM-dependent methyltransferase
MSNNDPPTSYITHTPTYHTDPNSSYILPNSPPEHVRLNVQAAHLSAIMNDQIVHTPLSPFTPDLKILDVGCGTGIVTRTLAKRFKHSQVWGLDLSDVPESADGPPPENVKGFLKGNILTDAPSSWTEQGGFKPFESAVHGEEVFNLIFSRLLVCGMNDWPGYVNKVFALLQPGGYFEMHDLDWDWYDASGSIISDKWKWWRTVRKAGEARGLDFQCASRSPVWMKEAGFESVAVKEYRWPFGGQWEKDDKWKAWGEYVANYMVDMCWHLIPRLVSGGEEEVGRLREEMKKDLSPEQGKEWRMKVVVGRKPGGGARRGA